MAGVAPVSPKIQFTSATGVPLAAGTVDVYLAGTTTRTTTWQDRGQATANQNPIELDSRGECLMWLDPALTYKFVVKNSAGVTQYTVDNVLGTGTTPTVASTTVDRFSGTGAQTAFTLSVTPTTENDTAVFVSGVYQQKNTYSLAGAVLTFAAAPAAGTNNVEVTTTITLDYAGISASMAGYAQTAEDAAEAAEAVLANVDFIAVAAALGDIATVAGSIASVNTAAEQIAAIQAAPAAASSALASQTASAASAAAADLSADLSAVAAAAAEAAAEGSGAVNFYGTKAEANAALAGLANLAIVEVFVDESMFGFRTRYRKEGGVYVLKLVLNAVRQYFVDANAGSDSNNGLTRDTPFLTIARVSQETLGQGVVINLKRGSKWREYLAPGNGTTVQAYGGSGAMPILDASDLVLNASFTLHSGVVYKFSVTRSGYSPRIYENDVLLTRRTSIALVQANPGSFTVQVAGVTKARDDFSVPSVTWDVYVSLPDSGNPITNGKTYEVTSRDYALTVGNESTVRDIHLRRNSNPNGSLATGAGCFVKGCLFEDGAKHNAFITSGLVEDCIAYKNEPSAAGLAGDSTMFVFYSTTYGLDVTVRRCKAIQGTAIGFYSHTDGGGNYRRIRYEDSECINVGGLFSGNECDQMVAERCKAYNDDGQAPSWMPGAACVSFLMIDCEHYGLNGAVSLIDVPAAGQTYEVRGGKFYLTNSAFARVTNTGTLLIQGAKICFENLGGESSQARLFVNSGNPAANVTFKYNVVQGASEWLFGSGATLALDYNVLPYGMTSDVSLTSQNKHSLIINEAFRPGDPRNGDWTMRADMPRPSVNVRAVAHSGGGVSGQRVFFAVGDDGFTAYLQTQTFSGDIRWKRSGQVAPTANDLFGVCWIARASNAFVAVGASGGIFSTITDPPGSAWTTRTAPVGLGTGTLRAIADDGAANTVAVGDGGKIIRSTDGGVNWADVTSPTAQHLYAVKFCTGSTWVAVGAGGAVIKSTDGGATWTGATVGSLVWYALEYGDSKYAIGGQNGTLYTSADATTWTQRYPGSYNEIRSITYGVDGGGSGQKMWIAACNRIQLAGGILMRAADPTSTWTEVESPVETTWLAGAFKSSSDSVFCLVGMGDKTLQTARGQGFQVKQIATRQSRTGGTPATWLSNAVTEMAKL